MELKAQKKTRRAIFSRLSFENVKSHCKSLFKIISVPIVPKAFLPTVSQGPRKNKTNHIICEKFCSVDRSKLRVKKWISLPFEPLKVPENDEIAKNYDNHGISWWILNILSLTWFFFSNFSSFSDEMSESNNHFELQIIRPPNFISPKFKFDVS